MSEKWTVGRIQELNSENSKLREANRRLQVSGPALERDKLRQRIVELEAELESARKVADAAGKFIEASNAWRGFNMDGSRDICWNEKFETVVGNQTRAREALASAVAEYRKLQEGGSGQA